MAQFLVPGITVSMIMVCSVTTLALMKDEEYTTHPGKEIVITCTPLSASPGDHILAAESPIECAAQCLENAHCLASQYANETCHVASPQLVSLQAAADAQSTAIVAQSATLLTVASIGGVGWWPLTKRNGGTDLSGRKNHMSIHGVNFPDDSLIPGSSVAYFYGVWNSYARLISKPDLALKSFSWMAQVFPQDGGRNDGTGGTLWSWVHKGSPYPFGGIHILFNEGTLYAVIDGNMDCDLRVKWFLPKESVARNEWHTMAVTYDQDANTLTLWVDGESQVYAGEPCVTTIYTSADVTIGKTMQDDDRYFHGRVRCMSIYSGVVGYNCMYYATMPYCDDM